MAGVIGIEPDFVFAEPVQPTVKGPLPVDWSRGSELYPAARETLIIRRLIERSLDARRRDFENVSGWNKVLDVDKRLDLLAKVLAVAMGHAAGFVDIYSEQHTTWRTDQVPVDQFQVRSSGYPLNEAVQDLSVDINH